MTSQVNALARTTGSNPVPEWKAANGYRYEADKFGCSGLTPVDSEMVAPPRVGECPVAMEAELVGVHKMFGDKEDLAGRALAIEIKILKVWVHEGLKMDGYRNRIDTDRWKPMIMMFSQLYGLGEGRLARSRLAEIKEEAYRPITGGEVEEDGNEIEKLVIEAPPPGFGGSVVEVVA